MNRRDAILTLTVLAAGSPPAFAQTRTARIGILNPVSRERSFVDPLFLQRLAELGYRETSGLVVEHRSAD